MSKFACKATVNCARLRGELCSVIVVSLLKRKPLKMSFMGVKSRALLYLLRLGDNLTSIYMK
jgi:hypothetical protein